MSNVANAKAGGATLADAVWGAAVGDALGVPYEFRGRGTFGCEGMVGHGTHDQPAGTWSDDTALMLATCDSIRAIGRVDAGDLLARFRSWYYDGAYSPDGTVFDVGNATAEALRTGRGLDGEWDNGNGSLMRIAPLAFCGATDDDVRAASAVTHAHPTSTGACVEFVRLLREVAVDPLGTRARLRSELAGVAAARSARAATCWTRSRPPSGASRAPTTTVPACSPPSTWATTPTPPPAWREPSPEAPTGWRPSRASGWPPCAGARSSRPRCSRARVTTRPGGDGETPFRFQIPPKCLKSERPFSRGPIRGAPDLRLYGMPYRPYGRSARKFQTVTPRLEAKGTLCVPVTEPCRASPFRLADDQARSGRRSRPGANKAVSKAKAPIAWQREAAKGCS